MAAIEVQMDPICILSWKFTKGVRGKKFWDILSINLAPKKEKVFKTVIHKSISIILNSIIDKSEILKYDIPLYEYKEENKFNNSRVRLFTEKPPETKHLFLLVQTTPYLIFKTTFLTNLMPITWEKLLHYPKIKEKIKFT